MSEVVRQGQRAPDHQVLPISGTLHVQALLPMVSLGEGGACGGLCQVCLRLWLGWAM